MAYAGENYPFRINIINKEGNKRAYFTSSFATDLDTVVSCSIMVNRINNMYSSSYRQDASGSDQNFSGLIDSISGGGNVSIGHGSHRFSYHNDSDIRSNRYLSASFAHSDTGSVVFTDIESTEDGGLDYYEFYGTKVCSVLGVPEGIPIYTENFKLSDSSVDTTNYLSGEVISDSVSIKTGLKLSAQARMRSNLIWDDAFGEGYVQWVSGSTTKQFMGYDPVKDLYNIGTGQVTASSATITNIKGTLTGNVTGLASLATTLIGGGVRLGEGFVIQSKIGDEVDDDGHKLILSASLNQLGNGGDIILQAGHNAGGASSNSIAIRGGHVVVRPGDVNLSVDGAFTEAAGSPGTRTSGSFIVSGSSTFTGNVSIEDELDVADGFLKLGHDAFSVGANYVGMKTTNMSGVNDYMIISGNSPAGGDGNTYVSAKDGSGVYIRGGGNNSANEIQVLDGDTINIRSATTYISGSLGVGIDPGTTKGLIRATNDVVAFYSSDKRLKDNLVKLCNPLDKIFQLNGYEFDWIPKEGIHENEGHDVGVIAQEVEKILPEIVQTRDNGYKAVKYEKIVPLLIESIKELTQRVEELENGSN